MCAIFNGGLRLWEKFTGEFIVKVARALHVSHYQSRERLLGSARHEEYFYYIQNNFNSTCATEIQGYKLSIE